MYKMFVADVDTSLMTSWTSVALRFRLHPARLCAPKIGCTFCVFSHPCTDEHSQLGEPQCALQITSPAAVFPRAHSVQRAEQQPWAQQSSFPAHYITLVLHAGYLLSISLPPRRPKEISKSPPAEPRIPLTIHSGAAGRPGINPRGNAVNSSTLFLPLAQLVVGILPHESHAVTIHHRYLGGRIPGHELASFGNSGAVSFCQMIRRRNPNSSTPLCSSPPSIFRGFQIP